MTLRCDMCHKPLKEKRYQLEAIYAPGQFLTVGPDCFAKEKKARAEAQGRYSPEQITAMRAKVAAHRAAQ
jgi:hypothetical protein